MPAPASHRPRARRLTSSSVPPLFAADENRLLLPVSVFAAILEYLPLSDYVACASICRAFRQIIYDDQGWILRLRKMGAWDDSVAAEYAVSEQMRHSARDVIQRDLANGMEAPLSFYVLLLLLTFLTFLTSENIYAQCSGNRSLVPRLCAT